MSQSPFCSSIHHCFFPSWSPSRIPQSDLFHSLPSPTKMRICEWNVCFRRQMKQSFVLSRGGRSTHCSESTPTPTRMEVLLLSPESLPALPGEAIVYHGQWSTARQETGWQHSPSHVASKEPGAVVAGGTQRSPGSIWHLQACPLVKRMHFSKHCQGCWSPLNHKLTEALRGYT